jgi:hypothetical protein
VIPFVKKKSEITPLKEFLNTFLEITGFTKRFLVKLILLFSISKYSVFVFSEDVFNAL